MNGKSGGRSDRRMAGSGFWMQPVNRLSGGFVSIAPIWSHRIRLCTAPMGVPSRSAVAARQIHRKFT
jgi:hypothetical protein